ncbi:uncharacterized protein LOC106169613 [Lingula anatina]|uniref:Uncharacterized protein LOC106169613 n=1 Tax=Lingula anatina TaxID=7574 RepID=A0A1S3J2S6_LINAN|nr:uncharacterized protein LOC106169613 [Lingula anatina]|eukprot:XP_013404581.1 uncharacterized protein LOC106169613 [Lingula anatina]
MADGGEREKTIADVNYSTHMITKGKNSYVVIPVTIDDLLPASGLKKTFGGEKAKNADISSLECKGSEARIVVTMKGGTLNGLRYNLVFDDNECSELSGKDLQPEPKSYIKVEKAKLTVYLCYQ